MHGHEHGILIASVPILWNAAFSNISYFEGDACSHMYPARELPIVYMERAWGGGEGDRISALLSTSPLFLLIMSFAACRGLVS